MIYRTRANREYCKERDIRLSGPKLGRPSKQADKKQRRLELFDERIRSAIEGKFGEGRRCYGLARIKAKLKQTNETDTRHVEIVVLKIRVN